MLLVQRCQRSSAWSTRLSIILGLLLLFGVCGEAQAQQHAELSFETLILAPWPVEAVFADDAGNLYTGGRAASGPCPIWRVPMDSPRLIEIGTLAEPCSPGGLVLDGGALLVLSGGSVWSVPAAAGSSSPATLVTSGLPGANGIAMDRNGNLFVSDGTTGQGRVWRVGSQGSVTLAFQTPALANDAILSTDVGGVGRDHRSLPQGQITITPTNRAAADTQGSQPIVANGLAFDAQGALYVADTGRGAIWRASFDAQGNLVTPTGCDVTYPAETLCMEALWVAHPLLEGADAIEFDRSGDLWVAANERNAVVVVHREGRLASVTEAYRNPPDPDTMLRNAGPLEFPTGLTFSGDRLCVVHTDTGRRDNAPPSAGEINPQGEMRGKISCALVR